MANKKLLLLIGLLGLCAGTFEYLCGRSLNSTYLLNNLSSIAFINGFFSSLPRIYGCLGQWIPDFFHAFSFSLISIALFSKSRSSRIAFCLLWFGIDSLFEIGQKYGAWVAMYIPSWFEKIPFLENTKNYFVMGRFDILDIVAISLGAFMAYLASEFIGGEENAKEYNFEKTQVGSYASTI